jgi:protein-S-isoprenylcysteine O-methyltransferase Ste14
MITTFQFITALLGALFLFYGMDVRRKPGTGNFVAPVWQALMKLCAFALLGGIGWIVLRMQHAGAAECLGLAFMAAGTAFVVAAKRALGASHTFTGQYRERPQLVTRGVYAVTRNPLYFGVFLVEIGALLCALHQVPILLPDRHLAWFGLFGAALAYAVGFNCAMAVREARELERRVGEEYRRYRAAVPFLVPFIRFRAGAE